MMVSKNLLDLKRIVGASVIKVVAETCNDESHAFQLSKHLPPLSSLKHNNNYQSSKSLANPLKEKNKTMIVSYW